MGAASNCPRGERPSHLVSKEGADCWRLLLLPISSCACWSTGSFKLAHSTLNILHTLPLPPFAREVVLPSTQTAINLRRFDPSRSDLARLAELAPLNWHSLGPHFGKAFLAPLGVGFLNYEMNTGDPNKGVIIGWCLLFIRNTRSHRDCTCGALWKPEKVPVQSLQYTSISMV